jgi:hypothetical protein
MVLWESSPFEGSWRVRCGPSKRRNHTDFTDHQLNWPMIVMSSWGYVTLRGQFWRRVHSNLEKLSHERLIKGIENNNNCLLRADIEINDRSSITLFVVPVNSNLEGPNCWLDITLCPNHDNRRHVQVCTCTGPFMKCSFASNCLPYTLWNKGSSIWNLISNCVKPQTNNSRMNECLLFHYWLTMKNMPIILMLTNFGVIYGQIIGQFLNSFYLHISPYFIQCMLL